MSKTKLLLLGLLILAAGGGVWAYEHFREDPEVAKANELRDQLIQGGRDLSREQRGELFSQMRDQMGRLTDEQRQKLWEQGRADFEKAMEKRLDDYFSLPPEERVAYLDKQIDDMEQRKKESQERRKQQGDDPPGAGSPEGRDRNAEASGDRRSNNPGQASASPRERRKQRLDNTSPEMRAKFSEYMRAVRERREQRGMTNGGSGGFGGRGPF